MNISELAEQLGVAVSTVSRVLSGNAEKYRISAQTVARIQEAAERQQVAPDPLGAGLRRGKLGMIGLLVPDITNPFFSQLARAIEWKLRDTGVAVQLCDSAEDAETELGLLEKLLTRRLDGMIIAPVGTLSEKLTSALQRTAMPIVLIDRLLPGLKAPSVSLNNREAGKLAADRLLEAGHRQIGCLRGDPNSKSDEERFAGVIDSLDAAGLSPDTLAVAGVGYTHEDSLEQATQLLSTEPRSTGIITLSGQGILGILEVARQLNLRIPEDFSVVAFDEQPWSPLIHPPLTTVAQPIEPMAEKAVDILRALWKDKPSRGDHVFSAHLIERDSVEPPAIG